VGGQDSWDVLTGESGVWMVCLSWFLGGLRCKMQCGWYKSMAVELRCGWGISW